MTQEGSVIYTIQAFGLSPEGVALARIVHSDESDAAENRAGRVVLCDGLMPGEIAEVFVDDLGCRMLTARRIRILQYSPDRTDPFCPVYSTCGGCTCQTLTYDALLLEKQRHVRDCLIRIARIPEDEADAILRPILPDKNPTRYRNHMQYHACCDTDGTIRFGLHARKSHEQVATPECAIAHPVADLIKNTIEQFLNEPKGHAIRARIPPQTRLIVRIGTRTGQVLYRLEIPGASPPEMNEAESRTFFAHTPTPKKADQIREHRSENRKRHRLITIADIDARISQTLRDLESPFKLAANELEERIGARRFFFSPESFFQVNTNQAERLYDTVLEFYDHAVNRLNTQSSKDKSQDGAGAETTILDLYCGIGSIGLYLSDRAQRLVGIEVNAQAIADARRNAQINKVTSAEYHVGLAEEYDYHALNLKSPLIVVLDPPRKGCAPRLLEQIFALSPAHILYVSCDPATLSRDLRILIQKGYHPEAVQPIDLFPWTGHVESIILMTYCGSKENNRV